VVTLRLLSPGLTLAAALGLAVTACPVAGQDDDAGGDRPRAAQRVVKTFGFEEWLTNPLEVPAGWVRAQHDPLVPRDRPGFPIWNKPKLDYEVAAGGDGSVRLPVRGGSTSLRLNPGVAPIFPLGQYLIRVKVWSEGLIHARPRLVVRALDRTGAPIAGSERMTLAGSLDTAWRTMEVELPGLFPDAAYLQVDLEVVQPVEFKAEALPGHQVWDEDFSGQAWFDDLVVMQVPQLSLRTTSPLNVVARPDVPVLTAGLRDLAAEDMTATIRVFDARRELVDSMQKKIVSGRTAWEWQPALDELGWYRAVIDIAAGGRLISTETRDFVWVAEPRAARQRYGKGPTFSGDATNAAGRPWHPVSLELDALPPATPDELAQTLRALGVRSVSLPVWESGVRAEVFADRVERVRSITAALRAVRIDARLSLAVVPDELTTRLRVGPDDVLDVLAADPAIWEPYLLDALDRLGTTSARWQLGSSGGVRASRQPDLSADITAARAALAGLVPGVEIAIGWRADLSPASAIASGADSARIELPAWMTAAPTGVGVAPWRGHEDLFPEFVIEPLDAERYAERDVAADLARRATELWAAASAGTNAESSPRFTVAIANPWRIERGEQATAHPTAASAAWRAIADRLDGRVLAVDWPIADGVRCLVFTAPLDDPDRGGLLVAWREGASPEDAVLSVTLGKDPVRAYDTFGNARIIDPTNSADGARLEHRVSLSPEPVFVEGIDTQLALFLTSVTLDPLRIQSFAGEHEHTVTIRNPWDVPATGRVIVTEPGGYDPAIQARDRSWEITPRTMAFDLEPGESVEIPVLISFSRATEAGSIDFVFDVQLVADRDYGWVRAKTRAELAWDDVTLDLTYRVPPGGADGDLIIEATVTNTGDSPRALEAIAQAAGMPRVRSSIGTLQPGQSIVRRFPFPDGAKTLAGRRVIVSLSEPDGPGRLTKGIEVPGG
jgi:hypothetical protein